MTENQKEKAAKKTAASKKERTVLTPEQRVEKLKQQLAEAEAKAEAKANKEGNELKERRAKLVDQIKERQAKVDEIDERLEALGYEVVEFVADATPETTEG